ncbi:MAG: response regulator transcription factor [Pseudomonadota bacterium]|nr:response regulator transcription factor [Pseudomonadota bacterium]
MTARILLVDAANATTQDLASRLRAEGFVVDVESDGVTAFERAVVTGYGCVVTELDLPGVSGLESARRLRADPRTARVPIIVISTRDAEIDRVVAFEVGVDDYVVKPCSWRELALRILARTRTLRGPPLVPPPFHYAGMEFDLARFRVSLEGAALALTVTEVALLLALVRGQGAVVSRESLLRDVWGLPSGDESRVVKASVSRLREKLGSVGHRLENVRGAGYRLPP